MSINSGGGGGRPLSESLMSGGGGQSAPPSSPFAAMGATVPDPDSPEGDPTAEGDGKNKLGTCNGVIIPCLLNIFGAIIFVRLPWAVGQSGWLGVILQFAVAGSLVTLTTLSIAAISTNGLVRGGGAYYMLSRSLGPEFGAAVGIAYYTAASISIAFYLIAFAENMVASIKGPDVEALPFDFPGQEAGLQLTIGSAVLLLLLVQSQLGAESVAKANSLIFVLLVSSIALAIISFLAGGGHSSDYLDGMGYRGLNWGTFMRNVWAEDDTRVCVCHISGPNGGDGTPMMIGDQCGLLQCTLNTTCDGAHEAANAPAAPPTTTTDLFNSFLFNLTSSSDTPWPTHHNHSDGSAQFIVPHDHMCPTSADELSQEDLASVPTGFFQVFIVIFPAVTGIMAGTNFSGDLADPGKSIGYGTLVAIGSSIVVYLLFALIMGASLDKSVMANQDTASVIIQNIAFHPAIVIAGLVASTVSSALGALVGSARILQVRGN